MAWNTPVWTGAGVRRTDAYAAKLVFEGGRCVGVDYRQQAPAVPAEFPVA